jgi:hypothetical protein
MNENKATYQDILNISTYLITDYFWYIHIFSYSLYLFSIIKIGLQQFSWTTDTWDIR